MSTRDESDTVSERETQFVDQSGDEEVLWAVQEITAERGNKYRVKWIGIDPDTGKPWAQSWVAKHDCTDDLVYDWKAKKKRLAERKRGRQTSTASRTSGTSKRAGSSTSGMKTRRSTSNATSSRVDSVDQHASSPPKPSHPKRKLQSGTPVATSSGAGQGDGQGESSRPRKKQKLALSLEALLPPITSDEEEQLASAAPVKVATQSNVPSKSPEVPLDVVDEAVSSHPKTKVQPEHPPNVASKGTSLRSKLVEVHIPSKKDTRDVPRRKERTTVSSNQSEIEELAPPRPKQNSMLQHKSLPEQNDGPSKKVQSMTQSFKIGPPRGVKRRQVPKKSEMPSKSRSKPLEVDSTSGGGPHSPTGRSRLLQSTGDDHSPSRQIAISNVHPSARPRLNLSPGAEARLVLFDRMMADPSEPSATLSPPVVSEHLPDDPHFDIDDSPDAHDASPPPLIPPLAKFSKLGTPKAPIVPETESSGNSQNQTHPSPARPRPAPPQPALARDQPPRKPLDLPTIAVIAPSAASSSPSPQNSFPLKKRQASTHRPLNKSIFKRPKNASKNDCSMTNASSRIADLDAPPSSIESFTSPKPLDKGKQRAVEDDEFQTSLSEEEDGRQPRKKVTDSQIKRRGKELFDQVQLAREAEYQKNKKTKQLKTVDEIVNGTVPPSNGPPVPFVSRTDQPMEMQLEDLVDFSGGANSTTLDTPEQSEARPLSDEKRERLRIELRQEEEESTQEAMGTCPAPPPLVKESQVTDGDVLMPPPKSPKTTQSGGRAENVDHVEQPSTDLNQASVIVQASQEQPHEDMDMDVQNQPPSSPPRPIPQNLTDSPRRRLGEALSVLNVKSEEIQRLERELAEERRDAQGLKDQMVALQQSSEPTGPVRTAWEAERAQWIQERSKWENDFSVLETQRKVTSEENANLTARLAELSDATARAEEARLKLSELETGRATWIRERDVMLNDLAQRSEELANVSKVRDQDRLERETERVLWDKEKAGWETERATLQEKQEGLSRSVNELTASAESMKASMVSAEKDRDFFREQYAQASSFVGSVREENVELEKRVKIAEGQAQEGVAGIKRLFEGRAEALQADVERWKALAVLLQEKDTRTNNELRLRAAQVPELRELCDRLHTENKSLEAEVHRLGVAKDRGVSHRNRLFYEILMLKKERASLRSKLSKRTKKADNTTSTQETETSLSVPSLPFVDDIENMDPNDIEIPQDMMTQSSSDEPILFPCLWRPQWRDQCQQIFDTKEDLERHMQDHFHDLLAE